MRGQSSSSAQLWPFAVRRESLPMSFWGYLYVSSVEVWWPRTMVLMIMIWHVDIVWIRCLWFFKIIFRVGELGIWFENWIESCFLFTFVITVTTFLWIHSSIYQGLVIDKIELPTMPIRHITNHHLVYFIRHKLIIFWRISFQTNSVH